MLKQLLFVVTFSYCYQLSYQADYCYAEDDNPYLYFSYLTSYSNVRTIPSSFRTAESCTPVYVLAIIKHATTYMTAKEIEEAEKLVQLRDEIVKNHPSRGKLCEKDLENLRSWTLNLDKTKANELADPGIFESKNFVQRLKDKLKSLFETNTKESYEFQSGTSKSSKDTAMVIVKELLKAEFKDNAEAGITENELLKESSLDDAKNVAEMESFIKSDYLQNIIKAISTRLGFEQPLSYDQIISMYKICAYENAWVTSPTPAFCAAFQHDDLKAIEYICDLKHYYELGYGNSQNEDARVLLIKDILKKLSNAADEQTPAKKATFYFSNGVPISEAAVKLGLYRDEQPIKHDNYETMKESRKWRSSSIDSFSTNLLAVIYSCPNNEDKKVGFYHNENLLKIPSCTDDFCSLKQLKEVFKEILEEKQDDKTPSKPKPRKERKPRTKKGEPKPNEPKPEDKKEEPKPNEPKPEDKKEEPKPNEPKPEDKKEEPKPNEPKPEDKKEEPKPNEPKPEDKKEEPKPNEPKPEDKKEEPKPNEPKPEDKKEEPKPNEPKPEDKKENNSGFTSTPLTLGVVFAAVLISWL